MIQIQTWTSTGTRIGKPDPWWTRSWMGWGEIGTVEEKSQPSSGPPPIQYAIDGEWLTTAQIARHRQNSLQLSQRGIQSRIDRLRRNGLSPYQRGGSPKRKVAPATYRLQWRDFQEQATTSNQHRRRDRTPWQRDMVAR